MVKNKNFNCQNKYFKNYKNTKDATTIDVQLYRNLEEQRELIVKSHDVHVE